MNGLSTNRRCTSSATCLAQNDVDFVIRYYSETTQQPEKHLLASEARALHAAGIRLAVVYQDRQTQPADFSRAAGHRDGRFAYQYAQEIGQPLGGTIFFAVDYDAQPAHLNQIKEYFRGAVAGLAEAAGSAAPYRLGVYGNGYICRQLKTANLVIHTWLSESTGHLQSSTYTDWNVKQIVTNQPRCQLPAGDWQRCVTQGADRTWMFRLGGAAPLPQLPSENEPLLKKGDKGPAVITLQKNLNRWLSQENAKHLLEDGDFGTRTDQAVKAFQSSHTDNFGRPLVADGVVGGLTWGTLKRVASGAADPASHTLVLGADDANWWKKMPDAAYGGSARGLAALKVAVAEAKAGRGESGGNNSGPDVEKYLNGIVATPANWCAGFVSWCLKESGPMPFDYTVGARSIRTKAKAAGLLTFEDPSETTPLPGDIVVWWRGTLNGWEGHTGFVHHVSQGRIYTIEGNKTSKVEGFDYPLAGMEKLLGFVRL